jgi:methionyl-tRNA synthetase
MRNIYITTTLPYVNDNPHVGHALEFVQADTYARTQRLQGNTVFFNTGTDEHGQKIFDKAKEEGRDVQEYVDFYAERFKSLKEKLNLSIDAFIRTTDPHHISAAQELWRRCEKTGDIYKASFEGLYCIGCERYLTERDVVEGRCPLHKNLTLERISEENYFFRFSKYTERLRQYLTQDSIIPHARRAEAENLIGEGLEDFSISRRKERMSWGIPVPGDEAQVMYVWFDALTNYISTLGWPEDIDGMFKKFWVDGTTIQMAGKDQVRFQSLMWQAMLLSADIKPTDRIVYHGFITSGGQKMSKSLGNVIDPIAFVDEFGTDAVRYFFLRHIHPFEDSDFTRERFVEDYNANLANGLGNLAARIMKMAEDNLEAPVVVPEFEDFSVYFKTLNEFNYSAACDIVWKEITAMDTFIQETAPFKKIKTDPTQAKEDIASLAVRLYSVARMLNPLMPETSRLIKDAVKSNKKPENLFTRK